MGSLCEFERTCSAVRSIGCLGGRVATRLAELISRRAAERGWSVEVLEIMPDHVLVRIPPASSPAHVAHQGRGFTSGVFRCEFRHQYTSLPTLLSKSYFVACVARVSEGTTREDIVERTARGKR